MLPFKISILNLQKEAFRKKTVSLQEDLNKNADLAKLTTQLRQQVLLQPSF